MEKRVLYLDYEETYVGYRDYFFELYRKSLPNTIAFFGLPFVCSLLLALVTESRVFFSLLALTLAAIPLTSFVLGYQSLLQQTKSVFRNMSECEKIIHFTFSEDLDGFDSLRGKDFSHISWDSIVKVLDRKDHLVFVKKSGYFVIPKTAFRSIEEFRFLEHLVETNVLNRKSANGQLEKDFRT